MLFLALLLFNTIMYVQDGAGALNCGVHGLHPPGALTGSLVIEYDNVCAGWGWCPVLRCPRATSCWCSSWALLLLNTIMYVQDEAGALNSSVHGLHPPGALTGSLVIEYDNVCAGRAGALYCGVHGLHPAGALPGSLVIE